MAHRPTNLLGPRGPIAPGGVWVLGAVLLVAVGCSSNGLSRWIGGGHVTISDGRPEYRDWKEVTPPPLLDQAAFRPDGATHLDPVGPGRPLTLDDCVLAGLEHARWEDGRPMILLDQATQQLGCPTPLNESAIVALLPPHWPGGVPASHWRYRLNETVSEIERAYWDLHRAETLFQAAEAALAGVRRQQQAAEARFERQQETLQRLAAVEVELLAVREQRLNARGEGEMPPGLLAAEAALRRLIGVPPQTVERITAIDAPEVEPLDWQWDHDLRQTIARNPGLVAVRDSIEESDYAVRGLEGLTRKQHRPEAAGPLRQELRENVENLYQLSDEVVWRFGQVYRKLLEAESRIELRQQRLAAAEKLAKTVDQAFQAGQATVEQVIEAERQLVEARAGVVLAQIDHRLLKLDYRRMRGDLLGWYGIALVSTDKRPPQLVPEPPIDDEYYWPVLGPATPVLLGSSGVVRPSSQPLPTSQASEEPIFTEELLEGPRLDQPTGVEDEDAVGIADGT